MSGSNVVDTREFNELQEVLDRIPEGWGRYISCGPGWTALILETHRKIMEVDPDYEVHQVKEKFGGLRYYIASGVEAAHEIADAAGTQSYQICQDCGQPGKPRGGLWTRTLCDQHAFMRGQKMKLSKHFEINRQGTDYFVGDLHGMYDLLKAKLNEVSFNPEKDRLFSVGDLIDRGPKSFDCLRLLAESWFHCVLGNHEEFLLGGYPEHVWFMNGGKWILDNELDGSRLIEHIEILRKMVKNKCYQFLTVDTEYGKIGVVHAESRPDWNDNNLDSRNLNLWGRTKMRSGNTDRIINIDHVVCGHTPTKKPKKLGNVLNIDQGAVHTGNLTLVTAEQIANWEQT